MIWFLGFVVLRVAAAMFFVLTAVYGIVSYSPFAFDMFIRPQLFPAVTAFVAWHHVWYLGAYMASVITLVPELRSTTGHARAATKIAHWLAVTYVVLFGAGGIWLIASPYLPRLWNDRRSLIVGALAFLPLLWLAAIDHVSTWERSDPSVDGAAPASGQRRLLAASVVTAVYLWGVHLARAVAQARSGGALPWFISSIWALTLDIMVFVIVYSLMGLIQLVAECTSARRASEHAMTTALVAAGMYEVLRTIVFPAISLGRVESASVAFIAAVVLAGTWSGVALRRPASASRPPLSALELLLAPACRGSVAVALLIVLPVVTFTVLKSIERVDWDFLLQRLCVIAEFAIAFGLVLRLTEGVGAGAWSSRAIVAPPLIALMLMFGVPRATAAIAALTGDRTLEPAIVLDRHAAAELSIALISRSLISRPGFDSEYFRYLQLNAEASGRMSIVVPEVDFVETPAESPPATRPPDIFMFVVDSLRRDYLSPHNPAVTFTPNIARFAADSFVFQNTFTRYGGTELAMPSIWVGGPIVRNAWSSFGRINAIEKLLNHHGYRVAISDYTVAQHLGPATPVTALDPDVPSVETDLCHDVQRLESYLDGSEADPRPIFAFASPMNVHILNTRHAGLSSLDGDYPGFYAPYASRLKRIDACFGGFTSYLKRHSRYDSSIILITSDHGDSLGEDGNWGHAFWLFPEDVRIPLILHIPEPLKPHVTTDLARITFSTDIAPTLAALLGDRVRKLGPLFGEPLLVPSDETLADRRRQPFLLVSSYGPTYGMLRRNGRLLYVSDLVDWREFAFDLTRPPLGSSTPIDNEMRRVNQRLIREGVEAIAAFYQVKPE